MRASNYSMTRMNQIGTCFIPLVCAVFAVMCLSCSPSERHVHEDSTLSSPEEASSCHSLNLMDVLGKETGDEGIDELFARMDLSPASISSEFVYNHAAQERSLRGGMSQVDYASDCRKITISFFMGNPRARKPAMYVSEFAVKNPDRQSATWGSVAAVFGFGQPAGAGPVLVEDLFGRTQEGTARVTFKGTVSPETVIRLYCFSYGGTHLLAEFDGGIMQELKVSVHPHTGLADRTSIRQSHEHSPVLPQLPGSFSSLGSMAQSFPTMELAPAPLVSFKPAYSEPRHRASSYGLAQLARNPGVLLADQSRHSAVTNGSESWVDLLGMPLSDLATHAVGHAHPFQDIELTATYSINSDRQLMPGGASYSLNIRTFDFMPPGFSVRAEASSVNNVAAGPAVIRRVRIPAIDHASAEWAAACAAMGWPQETTTFQDGVRMLLDEAGENQQEIVIDGWSMDPELFKAIRVKQTFEESAERLVWSFAYTYGEPELQVWIERQENIPQENMAGKQ